MTDASLDKLRDNLQHPGPSAWEAMRSLGAHGGEESLRLLREYAASSDWRYRRSAVEAIAGHALAGRVVDLITVALGDSSPYVVRTACEAVGRLAIPGARGALPRLAQDRDPCTREAALRAWRALWEPGDFEQVLTIHLTDEVEDVRKEAAWLLAQYASDENWQRLFSEWSTARLARYRVWACELAARFGTIGVEKALQALVEDQDGHVRKAARRALESAA
jgi:HEAT repeat protein